MKKLTQKTLQAFLKSHDGWRTTKTGKHIEKRYATGGYIEGLMLVTRIAIHAEIANHHPDVTLSYSTVSVKLSTHDAGGVTELDTVLAETIDTLAGG